MRRNDAVVLLPQQPPIRGIDKITPLLRGFVDEFSLADSTFHDDDLKSAGNVVSFH